MLDGKEEQEDPHNWSTSFYGLSTQPFSPEISDILMQPLNLDDIEIKPGMYLSLFFPWVIIIIMMIFCSACLFNK